MQEGECGWDMLLIPIICRHNRYHLQLLEQPTWLSTRPRIWMVPSSSHLARSPEAYMRLNMPGPEKGLSRKALAVSSGLFR